MVKQWILTIILITTVAVGVPLRQSTETSIIVGAFIDYADGKTTIKDTGFDANDIICKIYKNDTGSVKTLNSSNFVMQGDGMAKLTISEDELNFVGSAKFIFDNNEVGGYSTTTILPFIEYFTVYSQDIYDNFFGDYCLNCYGGYAYIADTTTYLQAESGSFSVEAWVYPEPELSSGSVNSNIIYNMRDNLSGAYGWKLGYYYFHPATPYLQLYIQDTDGSQAYSNIDIPGYNQWIHIVFTVDKSLGVITPYINGSAGTTTDCSSIGDIDDIMHPMTIGAKYDLGAFPEQLSSMYNGRIKGVGFYKASISSDAISDRFNGGNYKLFTGDETSLSWACNFNKMGGNKIYDVVNRLNGSLVGKVGYSNRFGLSTNQIQAVIEDADITATDLGTNAQNSIYEQAGYAIEDWEVATATNIDDVNTAIITKIEDINTVINNKLDAIPTKPGRPGAR